ncbi:MAG: PAS domain S-box protein [Thermodesulfobacteriota bacterium]
MKLTPLNIKLVGGFAGVILITLLVGLAGWLGVSQVKESFEEVSGNLLPSIVGLNKMMESQWAAQRAERILLYEKRPKIIENQHQNLKDAWVEAERGRQTVASLAQTPEEAKLWGKLLPKWETWEKFHRDVLALINRGDEKSLRRAYALSYGTAREARLESHELLEELLSLNIRMARDHRQKSVSSSTRTKYLLIASTLIAVLVSLMLGTIVSRSIHQAYTELDQIFNTSSNGMRLVGRDSKIIRINETFAALAGVRPEEAVGRTCYDIFPGDFCRTPQCALTRILNGEPRVEDYIEKRRSSDGRLIPCILTATPLRDAKGHLIGILEEFKDISKLKEAEAALRRSEKWFATTLRSIGDAVIATDAQGLVTFMNPVAESMTGWRLEESRGRPVQEVFRIINEETGQPGEDPVARVIREGVVVGLANHTALITKDGRHLPIEDSGAPIRDDQEAIIGVVLVFHDISERQRAAVALRHSEATLRAVFQESGIAISLIDRKGYGVDANPVMQNLLGYSLEDLRRMHFREAIHPDDLQAHLDLFQDLLEGKRHHAQMETRYVKKDGGVIWGRLTATVIRDAQGNFQYAVAMLEDVTAHQQAVEALKKSEEQYRLIFHQSPLGILHFDEQGVVQHCNDNLVHILGGAKEKIIGFNIPATVKDEGMRTAILHALSGKVGYYEGDYRSIIGDKVTPLRVFFRGITGDTGEFLGGMGIFEDISARKRAEEAFHNLVSSSPIGIFIVQEGLFKLVNPGFQKLTGYSEGELLDQDSFMLISPEFREVVRDQATRMLKGQDNLPYEYQFLTKGGEIRWALETVIPSQYLGQRATLGYFLDITEHKRLEGQYSQAQRMEAVGRLAGGVAHDFNNLLSAIMGYGDLMLMELPEDDPLRRQTEEIMKATERAASLTRQLLAFSRRQILHPRVINLNEVVTDLEKMLRRLLGEDIDLVTALKPVLGAVKADPGQIEQVIMNLAVNARDAMPRGGTLTIETANVNLDQTYSQRHREIAPGPYVMLAVSDSGLGMDAATQARIFEPFFTTKEAGKGTGLGLATVYGIVKQSGGYIYVYSEPGQGTTFKVYLPRVDEPVQSVRETPPPTPSLQGRETILMVEDDEVLRSVITKTLKKFGYRVLKARDGDEALSACQKHKGPIHLLLTDVVLPKMSGVELADRLKGFRPEMKILFMSGYTEDAMVHHGVMEASTPFLQKPFKPIQLAGKVREILGADPGSGDAH